MSNKNKFVNDDYFKLPTVEDNCAYYHGDPKDPVVPKIGSYRRPGRARPIPVAKQELFTGEKLNATALDDWCADIGVTKDNYREKPIGRPVPEKNNSADQGKIAVDVKKRDEQQKYYVNQRSQGAINKNCREAYQGQREMQCAVRMQFDKLGECRENDLLDDQECNVGWLDVDNSPRGPKKAVDPGASPRYHNLFSNSDVELATMEKWYEVSRQRGMDGKGVVNGVAEIPGRLPGSPRVRARLPVFEELAHKLVNRSWPPPDRWPREQDLRAKLMSTKGNTPSTSERKTSN